MTILTAAKDPAVWVSVENIGFFTPLYFHGQTFILIWFYYFFVKAGFKPNSKRPALKSGILVKCFEPLLTRSISIHICIFRRTKG